MTNERNEMSSGLSADERAALADFQPALNADGTPADNIPHPVIDANGAEIPGNVPRMLTGDEIGELLDSLTIIAELCESLAALMPMMMAAAGAANKPATPPGLTKRRG